MNINPYLFSTYYYFKYFNKKKYHYIFIIIPLNFPILENCIAHNVPAVYEVLGARIMACEARPGHPKSGVGFAWERQSHDLAKPEPEAAISRRKRILSCYVAFYFYF